MRHLTKFSGAISAIAAIGVVLLLWIWQSTELQTAADLEEHRQRTGEFLKLREADPQGALAFAQSELKKAERLGSDDQRRGNALELLSLAYIALEDFKNALGPASETVRIRKRAEPVNHELLALALGNHAVVLFALDRSAEADQGLREQLESWRKAFAPNDLRLAQKLEGQAEYVQKGFGRIRWVIELLKEAAAIREAASDSAPGRLAQTLQELAIYQLNTSEYSDADRNLAKAQNLLVAESERMPSREEIKAGLAQIFVLRAGIAGALAQRDQALEYAQRAKGMTFQDPALQVETDILVAQALSRVYEMMGDIDGATKEQEKVLEILLKNDALMAKGSIDPAMIPDTLLALGSLYLEQNDLGQAREALDVAREQIGETSDLLFKFSELERKSGNPKRALTYYQQALQLRKADATEVGVMFGTNRLPDRSPEPGGFGGEPGNRISVGDAVVLVPGGQFSSEAWLKSRTSVPIPVGSATNPARLIIRSKKVLSVQGFRAAARRSAAGARLYPKSALVFVHGYNVTFDDALRRGAQLVRDLNYDSPAFVYSWPSKGDWWRYGTDRVSANNAVASLVEFLRMVEAATGAEKIHVIAHSMGNRVLLPALIKVAGEQAGLSARIGEVILAAPAVPQDEFREWLAKLGEQGFDRFTLYASAIDKALRVGALREGGSVLAGYVASGEPLLHAKVHSIDVSEAEAGTEARINLNHDVFASNPVVNEDIRQLLQKGQRPPHSRIPTLEQRSSKSGAETYWYYRHATTPTK